MMKTKEERLAGLVTKMGVQKYWWVPRLPYVYATAALVVFSVLVGTKQMGETYYEWFSEDSDITFFSKPISTMGDYAMLIIINFFLGFMNSYYERVQSFLSPISSANTPEDSINLLVTYYDNKFWAVAFVVLCNEIWSKVFNLLHLFLSFVDLYVFLAGLLGNVCGSLRIFYEKWHSSNFIKGPGPGIDVVSTVVQNSSTLLNF